MEDVCAFDRAPCKIDWFITLLISANEGSYIPQHNSSNFWQGSKWSENCQKDAKLNRTQSEKNSAIFFSRDIKQKMNRDI